MVHGKGCLCPRAAIFLSPKSVLKWKMIGGSKDVKGRLVAQGFQDRQSISIHKYFCRYHFEMGTERIIIALATQFGWPLYSADISEAFLRGITLGVVQGRFRSTLKSC